MQENNVVDAYPSFHKNYWAIIFFISVFVKFTVLKRNRIFSISNSLYLVHFMIQILFIGFNSIHTTTLFKNFK